MITVLYHNIVAEPLDSFDQAAGRVHVDDFRREMETLLRKYRPISVETMLEHLESGETCDDEAVITFDDGYRGVLTHALPVLKELGAPAAVFVVTGHVSPESSSLMHFDELEAAFRWTSVPEVRLDFLGLPAMNLDSIEDRVWCMREVKETLKRMAECERRKMHQAVLECLGTEPAWLFWRANEDARFRTLSWEEMKKLMVAGISIGSHTRSHRTLSQLPEPELQVEIQGSLGDLRNRLGLDTAGFAHPYGSAEHINDLAAQTVKEAGYSFCFTTFTGDNTSRTDRFWLRRNYFSQLLL
jgi:peptidoglycan/xylan/chitin deacetylase (PgdA/CDA1 family)